MESATLTGERELSMVYGNISKWACPQALATGQGVMPNGVVAGNRLTG
jgi:hypothetical protein